MNPYDRDEQQVRAWLEGEARGELPDWVLRHTFAITRATPQQRGPRGWLTSIRHRIASGTHRRNNMFTLATITSVAAAAILALNVIVANESQPSMTGAAEMPDITVEEETFTGRALYGPLCVGEDGVEIDDCYQLDMVSFDDPRFQGSVRMRANSTYMDDGIYRNQFTITTEEGAWVGGSVPGILTGEDSGTPSVHLFEGEGAYESLYAVAAVQLNGGAFDFEGHVVHGGFPEIPEG